MQQITIAGKTYPISFGFAALYAYEQWRGKSLLAAFNTGDALPEISTIVDLAFVGLQQGARKERQSFQMQPEDVADLITEGPECIPVIMEIFSASFPQADATIGYEYNHRQAWEIARYNATLVMMPHLKKGSKLSPRDLSLLPWELEVSPIEITPEQHAANLEEFDKVYQAILDGSAKLVPVKSEKELK
jgi:hypothetical protein